VRLKHRMRTLLCCTILEFGALFGIPMRPEQIRDLLHSLNQPKMARTDPDRTTDGGDIDPASGGVPQNQISPRRSKPSSRNVFAEAPVGAVGLMNNFD